MSEIKTLDDARMALQEVEMDVAADMGEEAVEAGWRDLVYVVADQITDSELKSEFLRTQGFGGSW